MQFFFFAVSLTPGLVTIGATLLDVGADGALAFAPQHPPLFTADFVVEGLAAELTLLVVVLSCFGLASLKAVLSKRPDFSDFLLRSITNPLLF